jgi:hypothetical protein
VHYAPPSRPGSSSSGLPVARGPAGDSGPLAFEPSARPAAARSASRGGGPATADAPLRLDVGNAATSAGEQAEKKPRRKPLEFAGLPLGFWLIAAVGLAIAIFLAVKILNR